MNDKVSDNMVNNKGNKTNIYILIIFFAIIAFVTITRENFWGNSLQMGDSKNYGILSVMPALIAVTSAFITREAIFSLLVACITGLYIHGEGIIGLPGLFEKSLGNADFIWVALVEVFIGVLVAFFLKTGSTDEFGRIVDQKIKSRKGVQLCCLENKEH